MTKAEVIRRVNAAFREIPGWSKRQMFSHITADVTDPVEAAWAGDVAAEYMEQYYRDTGTSVHTPVDAVYRSPKRSTALPERRR